MESIAGKATQSKFYFKKYDINFEEKFKDSPIYYYGGHGSDKCNKDGNLLFGIVPQNSIYVTKVLCGDVSRSSRSTGFHWEELTFLKEKEEIIRYPYLPKNKKILKENFPDLHIHLPGDPFIISNFLPFAYHQRKYTKNNKEYISVLLALSGLSNVNKIEDKGVTIINSALAFEKPTIFNYNRKYGEKISREDFLKLFSASVSPTKEEVKLLLDESIDPTKTELDTDDLQRLISIFKEKMRKNTQDLMTEFPGIHYFFICRAVSESCTVEKIEKRRRQSNFNELARNKFFEDYKRNIIAEPTKLENISLSKSSEEKEETIYEMIDTLKNKHPNVIKQKNYKGKILSKLQELKNITIGEKKTIILKLVDSIPHLGLVQKELENFFIELEKDFLQIPELVEPAEFLDWLEIYKKMFIKNKTEKLKYISEKLNKEKIDSLTPEEQENFYKSIETIISKPYANFVRPKVTTTPTRGGGTMKKRTIQRKKTRKSK